MTNGATARLAEIALPDFGMPDGIPSIPQETYGARLERLRARIDERGLDRLVVYADREHSANLAYLTGFDPRFEEAVLVVGPTEVPGILVGNECYGLAGAAPLLMRRRLVADVLGIDLHPDVLPFSNIPAYLSPFLLRPDRALTVAA